MVSIVIPAYNKQDSILETLNSVFSQSFKNFEVIVIDDGSTDNTQEVIKSFKKDIVYLFQENKGQGAARNTGIKAAKGNYVVFLDADDYWEPTFLERCHDFLENHPNLVAVNTAQRTIYNKNVSEIHPKALIKENPVVIDDFFKVWAEHDHIRTGTAMIRMKTVKQAGLQNPDLRISQDLEYWGLIATYGKWGFIPEPLWVGNSRMHAKKTGWTKKYKIRRKLCPDVEEWEKRILPRITKNDLDAFSAVRGRVAIGYAHNKILGGNISEGKRIVKKYQSSFPKGQMSRLLQFGSQNKIFWFVTVLIIKIKERIKDL
ncbi:glycosyltransferase family 2 protein [Winogradskyella sp. R77965]|uniref:glycosyltransferase family 2 protein n=1 Tax=Winogradskyella sp. R77965 TaxID=3093872 RepID=UPI0037DC6515